MQCLCSGAVQRGVDAGVCRLCGGAVSGPGRAVAMLGVWCGRGDGYAVGCGCGELHGVCGGRVQCAVDVGVCALSSGVDYWQSRCGGCDDVHAVWGWPGQHPLDDTMCTMRQWCYDRRTPCAERHILHSMRGWPVQL